MPKTPRSKLMIGLAALGCLVFIGTQSPAQQAPGSDYDPESVIKQLVGTIKSLMETVRESDSKVAEFDSAIKQLRESGLADTSEPMRLLIKARDEYTAAAKSAQGLAGALAEWMGAPLKPGDSLTPVFEAAVKQLEELSAGIKELDEKIEGLDQALAKLIGAGITSGEPIDILTDRRKEYNTKRQEMVGSLQKLVSPSVPRSGAASGSGTQSQPPSLAASAAVESPRVTTPPAANADRAKMEQAQKLFLEGEELFNSGDFNAASGKFDDAIAVYPGYAPAFFSRGLISARKGDYNRAIKDFDNAIELAPDSMPEAYFNRGVAYFTMKNYPKALENFNDAIKIDPQFAEAYNGHGAVYASQGKLQDAVSDFTQAITINPKLAEPYYNRALSYNNIGNKKAAVQDLQSYLKFPNVQFRDDAAKLLNTLKQQLQQNQ